MIVIATGLTLRIQQYVRNNSLWGDEAMLALSIASRPIGGLHRPLAYGQVAPLPFLWAERAMVALFGVSEWALRALPFLAGTALCVAIVLVARRMLRPDEIIVALVLTAFSQILVRYSAEVKSYSLDALLTIALIGVTAGLITRIDSRKCWILLSLLGALIVVSSLSALFVCLGVVVALGIEAFKQERRDLLPRIIVLGLVWVTLFSLTYSLFYRAPGDAPYMRTFWGGAFLIPGSPRLLARTAAALVEASRAVDSGWTLLGLAPVVLGLVLLGTLSLWRRRGESYALLLLLPGIAPFAASAFGVYPIATRLMLFAAPLLIMLSAVGINTAAEAVQNRFPLLRGRWVAALLLLPAVTTGIAATLYERDQQMRPLVQQLERRWDAGDAVYVFHRVVPAWLFYSTDWAAPNQKQLAWAMRVSGPGGLGHENGPTRGARPLGEGSDLVYDLNGHPVLLGVASGIQARPMFGYLPHHPDPGWASSEAQRIRGAASSRVWIILGNASHQGVDLGAILLQATMQAGGRLTFHYSQQDGKLYALEFPLSTHQRSSSAGPGLQPAAPRSISGASDFHEDAVSLKR